MCDLDIHITMRDREFNKVIEYNSLKADGHVFCIEAVNALIEQFRDQMNSKYYKIYTDDDYESLKVQPRGGEFMDDESIEQSPVDAQLTTAAASLPVALDLNCQLVNINLT